jgi:hypothetical protein
MRRSLWRGVKCNAAINHRIIKRVNSAFRNTELLRMKNGLLAYRNAGFSKHNLRHLDSQLHKHELLFDLINISNFYGSISLTKSIVYQSLKLLYQ